MNNFKQLCDDVSKDAKRDRFTSISKIQRRYRVNGYRALTVIEQLQEDGIIGAYEKPNGYPYIERPACNDTDGDPSET